MFFLNFEVLFCPAFLSWRDFFVFVLRDLSKTERPSTKPYSKRFELSSTCKRQVQPVRVDRSCREYQWRDAECPHRSMECGVETTARLTSEGPDLIFRKNRRSSQKTAGNCRLGSIPRSAGFLSCETKCKTASKNLAKKFLQGTSKNIFWEPLLAIWNPTRWRFEIAAIWKRCDFSCHFYANIRQI